MKAHAEYARKRPRGAAFPPPGDVASWDRLSFRSLEARMGPNETRSIMADVRQVHALPAVEVPPCLTLRQWLEIQETQPDP